MRIWFVGAVLVASPALAWGPVGHRTVGEIARRHLTPTAAAAVRDLLGTESLAEVSTWADEIRHLPEWKRAERWHFINLEDGETLATAPRHPEGDILEAMERMEATLRDRAAPAAARAEALRFLVHLVGDVHQPLHVGRRSDDGGNKVAVTFNGEATNLHWVWDALIIRDQGYSYSELAPVLDRASAAEIAAWQAASPRDWIEESRNLRERVYRFPADGKLTYLYAFEHWPLVKERLLQAGVRLAGRLDALFAPRPAR